MKKWWDYFMMIKESMKRFKHREKYHILMLNIQVLIAWGLNENVMSLIEKSISNEIGVEIGFDQKMIYF
jgi:hypothetical protein